MQERTSVNGINAKSEFQKVQLKIKNELAKLDKEGLLQNPDLSKKQYNPNIPKLSELLAIVQKTINVINLYGDKSVAIKEYVAIETEQVSPDLVVYRVHPDGEHLAASSKIYFNSPEVRAEIENSFSRPALPKDGFSFGYGLEFKACYSVSNDENPKIVHYGGIIAERMHIAFKQDDDGDRIEISEGMLKAESELNLSTGQCRIENEREAINKWCISTEADIKNVAKWHMATEYDIDKIIEKFQKVHYVLEKEINKYLVVERDFSLNQKQGERKH